MKNKNKSKFKAITTKELEQMEHEEFLRYLVRWNAKPCPFNSNQSHNFTGENMMMIKNKWRTERKRIEAEMERRGVSDSDWWEFINK